MSKQTNTYRDLHYHRIIVYTLVIYPQGVFLFQINVIFHSHLLVCDKPEFSVLLELFTK